MQTCSQGDQIVKHKVEIMNRADSAEVGDYEKSQNKDTIFFRYLVNWDVNFLDIVLLFQITINMSG